DGTELRRTRGNFRFVAEIVADAGVGIDVPLALAAAARVALGAGVPVVARRIVRREEIGRARRIGPRACLNDVTRARGRAADLSRPPELAVRRAAGSGGSSRRARVTRLARVEATVRAVAEENPTDRPTVERERATAHDDAGLTVRRHRQQAACEPRAREQAIPVEGRVEIAVGLVARQGE